MGRRQIKRQKQKLSNREKKLPAASLSPSSTMTPVPLSSGGTTMIQAEDYSSSQSSLPLTTTDCTKCRHIASGVNLDKLRRQLLSTRPVQECYDCTHPKGASNPKVKNRRKAGSAAAGAKKVMWICLACGQIGCDQHVGCRVGDSSNATQHYVVMKWGEDLDCLCLKCNAQLQYPTAVVDKSSNGTIQPDVLQKAATLLQEILFRKSSFLKEVSHVEADQVPVVPEVPEICQVPEVPEAPEAPEEPEEPEEPEVEEDFKPLSKPAVSPLTSRRVVKGLTNLGNTCFFNSVMQNLVGVSMLREHFSEEASEPEGVLKLSLRKFFQEMDPNPRERAEDSGSSCGYYDGGIRTRSFGGSMGNAVSPRGLFSAICAKAPRFKGYQQQDSHELLRCLLDGLHVEEESIRKAQADPNTKVDNEGKKLPDTLVENMFGGQFSSTVSCCECGHSSVVYEPFLDLSLPIPLKQSFGKVEPISIQLPKLLAQRSQSGDLSSGNGVLSVSKAAGFSSFNSGVADHKTSPKKPAIVPVLGFNLELSASSAGAGNGDTSTEHGSASGTTTYDNKDHIGQEVVVSTVTPFPCEAPSSSKDFGASSSGTEKIDSWLECLDAPMKGDFEEIGSVLMDSDAGAIGAEINQPGDGEAHPQEKKEEELDDIPLDNGDQMELEALVYGPQLPSATSFGPENKNECLAMVLSMPSNSNSEVKDDEIPAAAGVRSSTSLSNSKSGPIAASVKLLSRGSEGDGGFEGLGGLFDDDESSAGRPHKFETQSLECSGSFNALDSFVAVPAFGGSARNFHRAETYPIMSLEGCLQAFTKTEKLSGENAWACENCSRVAHRQRETELQEADCLKQLPETEWQGRDSRMQAEWESVGLEDYVAGMEDLSTSTNFIRNKSVAERSDRHENGTIMGRLSLLDDKKHSVQRTDDRAEGNLAELDTDVQNSSLGSKSHNRASSNTLNGLLNLDCFDEAEGFRPDKGEEELRSLSSHEGKEDAGESYAMVEVNADEFDDDTASSTGRRPPNDASNAVSSAYNTSRSLDMVMKDRKGKASAEPDFLAGASMAKEVVTGSKKKVVEKEALKMVTLKRDALKSFIISKAPLVLTVHLKRFAQDLHGRLNKLSGHITFHEQLDLGPFIDQRDGMKQGYVYQLMGTVEHSGTMRGGHYVAYVKGPKTESEQFTEGGTSTWYYISDSHVRKTTLESVLQSEAYLLFYERQAFE